MDNFSGGAHLQLVLNRYTVCS